MLRNQIQGQIKEAMRARDQVRLDALRYLWSEIQNEEIEAKGELDDAGVHKVVLSEVKKRKDALRQAQDKGGVDKVWVEEEEAKLKVIEEFAPEMMTRNEIVLEIEKVMAGGATDFGKVMGQVMGRVEGRADGGLVKELVEEKLKG